MNPHKENDTTLSETINTHSRESVLRLLHEHIKNGNLDAHEKAMAEDMVQFVERNRNCAGRSLLEGHLTGSAWIVDSTRKHVLLTHHRKLDKWFQLGGHADGDLDVAAVALREAREESGLTRVHLVTDAQGCAKIFDVDRHRIPARGNEPEHWHYDIRFLIEADHNEPLVVSSESKDLAWVALSNVRGLNSEESMLRMVRKTLVAQ